MTASSVFIYLLFIYLNMIPVKHQQAYTNGRLVFTIHSIYIYYTVITVNVYKSVRRLYFIGAEEEATCWRQLSVVVDLLLTPVHRVPVGHGWYFWSTWVPRTKRRTWTTGPSGSLWPQRLGCEYSHTFIFISFHLVYS